MPAGYLIHLLLRTSINLCLVYYIPTCFATVFVSFNNYFYVDSDKLAEMGINVDNDIDKTVGYLTGALDIA